MISAFLLSILVAGAAYLILGEGMLFRKQINDSVERREYLEIGQGRAQVLSDPNVALDSQALKMNQVQQ